MDTSCVVTGGARGIGRGIAERMVERGHRVVLTDIDGEAAAATAREIGAAEGIAQDIREPGSHREVAAAAARHGVLIAWFNNAGICHDGLLADMPEEVTRRQVEVNLLGTIWGMRAAIDAFGEHGGDIVNTASLSGLGPVPDLSVYAATKAAVVSLTMSVDAETPKSVRVHAVCPDGVQTAMLDAQTPDSLAIPARPLRRPDPQRRRGGPGGRRPGRRPAGGAEHPALAGRVGAGHGPRAVGLQARASSDRGPGEAPPQEAADPRRLRYLRLSTAEH